MKRLFFGLFLVGIFVFGVILLFSGGNPGITGKVIASQSESEAKVFVVDSSHLRFYIDGIENPDMVVKEGDKVRIEFTSSEGFHDWVIDEFNVATERVNPGAETSVEFIADKKGTFEYYCGVGRHRENGMFGRFIVE